MNKVDNKKDEFDLFAKNLLVDCLSVKCDLPGMTHEPVCFCFHAFERVMAEALRREYKRGLEESTCDVCGGFEDCE